jgi:hypothetical protein
MPSVASTCSYFALQQEHRCSEYLNIPCIDSSLKASDLWTRHAVDRAPVCALEVSQQARSLCKDLHVENANMCMVVRCSASASRVSCSGIVDQ